MKQILFPLLVILFGGGISLFPQTGKEPPEIKCFGKEVMNGSVYEVSEITSNDAIFNDFIPTASQKLLASISLSKQQVSFAPFKLFSKYQDYLSESRFSLIQKDKITTVGFSWGINTGALGSSWVKEKFNKIKDPPKPPDSTESPYITDSSFFQKHNARVRQTIVRDNYLISLGVNMHYFEVLGGTKNDLDNDGKIDNYYSLRGFTYTGNFNYTLNEWFGCGFGIIYSNRRAKQIEGFDFVPYLGGSASFSFMVFTFEKDYLNSESFINSLVIPSLIAGISLEYENSQKSKPGMYDNGVLSQYAVIPSLEFKISKEVNFKLSLPFIKKNFENKNNQLTLETDLQLSLLLKTSKDNN